MAWSSANLLVLALLLDAPQDIADPSGLLAETIRATRARAGSLEQYACTAFVERRRCIRPQERGSRCPQCPGNPSHVLAQQDRLRIEVSVSRKGELFSWPGNSSFRLADLNGLVGGGTTAVGEFAFFPITILLMDADPAGAGLGEDGASFSFVIPTHKSHYAIRGRGDNAHITPYTARIWVKPDGEIRRLEVNVTEPPIDTELASVQTVIDYETLIPRRAKTTLVWPDGTKAINETEYSGCRVFQAESSVTFAPPARDPIPQDSPPIEKPRLLAGSEIRIELSTPVDSDSDVTGNRVEGRLLSPIRDVNRKIVAAKGARIRGRIARLDRYFCPVSNYVLGLQFDEIRIGDLLVPIELSAPVYMMPVGGSRFQRRPERARVPQETRTNVENLLFRNRERLRIKPGLVTEWLVSGQ